MLQKLIALLASASPSAGRIAGQNPILVVVVGGFLAIFAVEFLAKEGIGLWTQFETAKATVAEKQAQCRAAVMEAAGKQFSSMTPDQAEAICATGKYVFNPAVAARKAAPPNTVNEGGKSETAPPPQGGSDLLGDLCIALAAILGDRAFARWGFAKKAEGEKAAALHQAKVSLVVVAFMFAFIFAALPLVRFLPFEYPPREVFGVPLSRDALSGLVVVPLVGAEFLFLLAIARQVVSLVNSGGRLLRKDAAA